MQDIADAAGMTKAALYYHFRDKTDLVSTMIAIEEQRLREGMQEFCQNAADLRSALEEIATYLFRTMTGDLPRLIMDVYKQLPREEVQKLDMQRSVFEDSCIYPLLRAAADNGQTVATIDPDLAAMLWFGMIFTQIRVARMENGLPAPPEDLARIITSIFLDGMLTNGH